MIIKEKVDMSSHQKLKVAHVILAAGNSSRMGEPKQLLPWKGTTLIGHAIQEALRIEDVSVFVVLGAYYDSIYERIHHFPITIIKNEDWKKGMGSSIQVAIKTIIQEKLMFDAVLVSLVDQPLIDTTHFKNLISEFETNSKYIVATDLKDKLGAPAIFPKYYFDELSYLKSDYGARYIIKKYKKETKSVSAFHKGIDIDTKKEYNTLVQGKLSS
ncbi:nucleotidyltransferase family protein [Aquimarina mytili]